jgi:uncharacterized protein (TIGR02284 family)
MAIPTKKLIEECNDLIRLDHDALGAYDEAIEKIDTPVIRSQLEVFRADHERHVVELSAIVRQHGGSPPEKAGARGIIRKTMTRIAGLMGVEPTLTAMRSNERVLTEQYQKRLSLDLPAEVKEVIARNFGDEQRHLAWIEQAIKTRLWEAHVSPTP